MLLVIETEPELGFLASRSWFFCGGLITEAEVDTSFCGTSRVRFLSVKLETPLGSVA